MINIKSSEFKNEEDKLLWDSSQKYLTFDNKNSNTIKQADMLYWLKRATKRKNCHMVSYNKSTDSYDKLGCVYITDNEDESKTRALPLVKVGERPCLFLDRDGVVNEDAGYIFKKEDIIWREDVFDTLRKINALGIQVVIITNQSGVGRGYYLEDDVLSLHKWMNEELAKNGIKIDRWYYCPHHPKATEEKYCKASLLRKPNSAMAELAFADFDIDPNKSLMIGDKKSDKLKNLDLETWFIEGKYELGVGKIITSLKDVLEFYI